MRRTCLWFSAILSATSFVNAQWAVYHDPSTPRSKDGKANFTAPVPRAGGKPDLSGIWEAESARAEEVGTNGLGEDIPSKYFFNFFADFPSGQEPMQPPAKAAFEKSAHSTQRPQTLCPLPTLPVWNLLPVPFKIVQTPRTMMILYEADNVYRQIFSDGRSLPRDPQPSWLGYSTGKWIGDSFVVETVGFNDKAPLDVFGHPRSEALRLTETFHRRDFGHLEIQITVDDPKTYTKPVTIRVHNRLLPDTELLETFCAENEKDLIHVGAK